MDKPYDLTFAIVLAVVIFTGSKAQAAAGIFAMVLAGALVLMMLREESQ